VPNLLFICSYLCSPLSPSEGLDDDLLFDLEQAELQDIESTSSSPFTGSKFSYGRLMLKSLPLPYGALCTHSDKLGDVADTKGIQ